MLRVAPAPKSSDICIIPGQHSRNISTVKLANGNQMQLKAQQAAIHPPCRRRRTFRHVGNRYQQVLVCPWKTPRRRRDGELGAMRRFNS